MVGQNAKEFAGLVVDLLNHPQKAAILAERGNEFVHRNFNWEAATNKLEKLITKN